MKKLIHSDWELDLTPFKISETEENSDFSDNLFSKIALPFEMDLTLDLDKAYGFISSYNTSPQTLYNVKYQDGDTISDAVFEILEENNGKLQCNYEYGLDEFPSWDKKLSELSLHEFDLPEGTSIYEHAQSILNQVYPAVDYNFPMIHAEFIDTTDETWENFEKFINKYVNGAFIENTIDVAEVIYYNRNYMQPLIFWMYILKKGVEDAGFTLHGDILTDQVLKKKMVFSPRDYFVRKEIPSQTFNVLSTDYVSVDGLTATYVVDYNITKPGKYLIQGTIDSRGSATGLFLRYSGIAIDGNLVWEDTTSFPEEFYNIGPSFIVNVGDTGLLHIIAESYWNLEEYLVISLELICLIEFDVDGDPIPNISNFNKVNLKAAVPDINFSDFVTATRKWRNYSFEVRGKEVWMNQINKSINLLNPDSLEHTEVESPARKFQQGMSFLLKFIDVDTKTYTWQKVFHSIAGFVNENYKTDSKTNTIEINAIPLPFVEKSTVKTAVAFEKDESKIYAVFYEGLQAGKNVTTDPTEMLLPQVHLDCWWKWFVFRMNAVNFKWTFLAHEVKTRWLNVRSKIYAYKNIHLVKSIVKTQVNQEIVEVEIETESIK